MRKTYQPEPSAWTKRQQKLRDFVAEHHLKCFKCGAIMPVAWAKTGTSKWGQPWAICFQCAAEYKRQKREDQAA